MLKPENIYSALTPMYYSTKILGFSPFLLKGKSSKLSSVVNVLWSTALICVYGGYAFYALNTAPNNDTIVVKIADSINTNLSILSLCGSILFGCIFRSSISNVIRGIATIDDQLWRLNLNIDRKYHYRKTKIYLIIFIFLLMLYMCSIIFVKCLEYLSHTNIITVGLVIADLAPLFSVFAELQFCTLALLIRKRFCWINAKMDTLKKQSGRNKQRFVGKRSKLAEKSSILSLLQEIGDKHHELCTIAKQLNKAYAVQILLFMIQAFLVIVIMSFYLIKMYLLNSFHKITANEKIVYMNILALHVTLVLIIVLVCSNTSKEARKAGILLHNSVTLNSLDGVESFDIGVACFSLQLLHHNVKFTACRLFTIDETLLYTVCDIANIHKTIVHVADCWSGYHLLVYIDGSSNSPEEIQHAICKIATEDIEASANATITRELKGVCTTKEVMERLAQLEARLLEEIKMIRGMEIKLGSHVPAVSSTEKSPTLLKQSKNGYQRDLEAAKNNQTIHYTELGRSFLYFWKVYDIENILTFSESSVQSGIFYVQGNRLQITLHPHHLGTHYLALELSSTNWLPKHRFIILNRNNEKGDLSSQILGMSIPLFRIHTEKISTLDFIVDGSLIIKLVISYY
ncbi:hypothetical protein RI129_001377 [Pyrocoelia pectoralis]|uniref:Gustatory receptor n=1 Tax=Pyrocoelia pectoralis TaxID=417401 RepID=A0AAN7ZX21_9COLE